MRCSVCLLKKIVLKFSSTSLLLDTLYVKYCSVKENLPQFQEFFFSKYKKLYDFISFLLDFM